MRIIAQYCAITQLRCPFSVIISSPQHKEYTWQLFFASILDAAMFKYTPYVEI